MDVLPLPPVAEIRPQVPEVRGKTSLDAARRAAEQFEAVMLSQSFSEMFKGVKAPAVGGGGHAEEIWKSLLVDEMAKSVAKSDSIGIAERIYKEIAK